MGTETVISARKGEGMELWVDPKRWAREERIVTTGIYVRACFPDGSWDAADISLLSRGSLIKWLLSRGETNIVWPINTILVMLGHDHWDGEEQP